MGEVVETQTAAPDVGQGHGVEAPPATQGPDGKFKSNRPPTAEQRKATERSIFDQLEKKVTAEEVLRESPLKTDAEVAAAEQAPATPPPPPVDPEKLRLGKEALKRIQVPKSVLSKMDDSEIAEFGEHSKEVLDENARLFQEVKGLRQAKEAATKPAEPAKAERPAVDFDALSRPFAEASFDENSGKALKSALQGVHAPLDDRIGKIETFLRQFVEQVKGNVHEGARAELVKRFHPLSDPEVSSEVQEAAEMLMEKYPARYGADPLKAWTRAAEIMELSQAEPVVPSTPPAARKGLPITDANRPPSKPVLSAMQKERLAFNAIVQNGITDPAKLAALLDQG